MKLSIVGGRGALVGLERVLTASLQTNSVFLKRAHRYGMTKHLITEVG